MTTTVQEFIKGNPPVVTVTLEDTLSTALKQMIQHDFSQLPVVNAENIAIGIVTSDSILRTLSNFGIALNKIRLRHAMLNKPHQFNENIDLFDVFDDMRDSYAIITDDEGKVVGIVTSSDLTDYFRQRAQDIILVENIESTIKDFVQLAFNSHPNGEARLEQAIESMTSSNLALRKTFEKSVRHYLGLIKSDQKVSFNKKLVNQVFEKYLDNQQPIIPFDNLTLSNYISLFLHNDNWARFETIFEVDKTAVDNLLKSVLNTRNDLSHFRDITRDQSFQLRYCYDLLVSHQQQIADAFADNDIGSEVVLIPDGIQEPTIDSQPTDDEPTPGDSRYAPLAIWLQEQPPEKELLKPTFINVEEIIGGKLPNSAYKNRSWWANDSVGHVQSKQWLDVGWRVASVNMGSQVVHFARIRERQRAYIDFYSALINELGKEPSFSYLQTPHPDGANWHWVKGLNVNGRNLGLNAFSFGRGGIFRIEIYIDSGDQEINKQLFDKLKEQKVEIENAIGTELLWQRLDSKRASRISRIYKARITDSEEELAALRKDVVPAMVKFVQVLTPRIEAIGEEIL